MKSPKSFLLVGTLSCVLLPNMSGAQVSAAGLEERGFRLLNSADRAFKPGLAILGLGESKLLSLVQPYSVLLVNQSMHGVVGCAIRWSLIAEDGQVRKRDSHFSVLPALTFPRANGRKASEAFVAAGGSQLISPFFSVGAGDKLPNDKLIAAYSPIVDGFLSSRSITISLDAVLLDDGSLVGPDQTRYGTVVQAQLSAERKSKRQIILDRNAYKSSDQIFAPVKLAAAENTSMPDHDVAAPEQFQAYFGSQLARDLIRLRDISGDDAVFATVRDLYKQPPKISRVPFTDQ